MEDLPPTGTTAAHDAARLVEQVLDYAIVALDPSGTVTSWNAGAQLLKGYTAAQAIGLSSAAFLPEDQRSEGLLPRLLADARRDGRVVHTGWRIRQDGTRFWADVLSTALRGIDGSVCGYAEVTSDLTRSRLALEEQRSFYDSFAHDFLTPVTALRGYAELLRSATPEDHEAYVGRIAELSERIAAMIGDLHHRTGRAESESAYDPESLGIGELIEAVRGRLGVGFDLGRLHSGLHHVDVRADRIAMERVLANVLGNALKYSDAGPVSVVSEERGGRVRITISDQGRGIDPADLAGVFDEFQRGRLSTSDGGSGLGLTSARRLVEQQGGTITLTSTLAVSTTVVIDLPSATPAAPPALPTAPPPSHLRAA